MKKFNVTFLSVLFMVFVSCGCYANESGYTDTRIIYGRDFNIVATGNYAARLTAGIITADTPETLRDLCMEVEPHHVLNNVDLNKYIVVAIFGGMQDHAGYEIKVTRALYKNGNVDLNYIVQAPKEFNAKTQAIVNPYVILTLRK